MRIYNNQDLIVYWDPDLCIHVSYCVKNLPSVFDKKNSPWVNINGAPPEEIIKLIDTCPSRALLYSLPEGSKADPTLANGPGSLNCRFDAKKAQVHLVENGPLMIKGPTELYDSSGNLIKESDALSLCRCGKTEMQPFCDGSHRY